MVMLFPASCFMRTTARLAALTILAAGGAAQNPGTGVGVFHEKQDELDRFTDPRIERQTTITG
jgi:hypothetical protein